MTQHFLPVLDEMRRQIQDGLRPSIQVAVDFRGRRVFDTALGDGASPESNYVLWSSTKPFVAVALLQLVDEGRAALGDRISKFIPEFNQGGKGACTIAHLLTHRGGFPDTGPLARDMLRVARDWPRAIAHVCEMEARWRPGTDRGYHPLSGWFIVGELVQRLDDRPLGESLRTRVLERAGIAADGFSLGEPERLSRPPMPVLTNGDKGAPDPAEAAYWNDPATHAAVIPGGSGISRANQIILFYRALLDGGKGPGGRLLSPEMVRTATFPHVVGMRDRTFMQDIPWGLGFHLKHVVPSFDDCGESATPGTFGHGGHFLVNTAWADPGRDAAACILSNGLAPPRAGTRGVAALSEAIHRALDSLAAES